MDVLFLLMVSTVTYDALLSEDILLVEFLTQLN